MGVKNGWLPNAIGSIGVVTLVFSMLGFVGVWREQPTILLVMISRSLNIIFFHLHSPGWMGWVNSLSILCCLVPKESRSAKCFNVLRFELQTLDLADTRLCPHTSCPLHAWFFKLLPRRQQKCRSAHEVRCHPGSHNRYLQTMSIMNSNHQMWVASTFQCLSFSTRRAEWINIHENYVPLCPHCNGTSVDADPATDPTFVDCCSLRAGLIVWNVRPLRRSHPAVFDDNSSFCSERRLPSLRRT